MFETPEENTGVLLPFNPKRLMRPILNLQARCARCAFEGLESVSARWASVSEPSLSPKLAASSNIVRAKICPTKPARFGIRKGMKGSAIMGATSPRWSAMAGFNRR